MQVFRFTPRSVLPRFTLFPEEVASLSREGRRITIEELTIESAFCVPIDYRGEAPLYNLWCAGIQLHRWRISEVSYSFRNLKFKELATPFTELPHVSLS